MTVLFLFYVCRLPMTVLFIFYVCWLPQTFISILYRPASIDCSIYILFMPASTDCSFYIYASLHRLFYLYFRYAGFHRLFYLCFRYASSYRLFHFYFMYATSHRLLYLCLHKSSVFQFQSWTPQNTAMLVCSLPRKSRDRLAHILYSIPLSLALWWFLGSVPLQRNWAFWNLFCPMGKKKSCLLCCQFDLV